MPNLKKPVYFNNAAGTYPKPACVLQAVMANLDELPENPYRENVTGTTILDLCRQEVAGLFQMSDPRRVVFCSGATEGLNMAVFGLARKGGHIITSCLEHNAVLRPLYSLRDRGYISLTVLPCNSDYLIDPHDIGDAIRRSTCLVVMNHASNVTGTVQSLDEIYGVCEQNEVPVLFDMSQSAGAFDINLGKKPLLIGAFTGHKSLMGPPGIGGLVVGEDVYITPTKFGGTGVFSERESMPNDFPSQLEPGTPNFPGIAGLCAGVRFIKEHGAAELAKKRIALVRNLCSFLSGDGYSMYTAQPDVNPCGVVSFCMDNWNCEDVGYILNHSFDIRIRTGLHCTPLIHKFTHTYPEGTIRVSFSCFNTDSEVNHLKDALTRIKEYT